MAFPTSDATPADAARSMIAWAKQMRAAAAAYIAQCDAGSLRVHDVAANFMAGLLGPIKGSWVTYAALPGIGSELARQMPGVYADGAAADTGIASVTAGITTLVTWLEGNLPVDAQRRLLSLTVSNNGTGALTQVTVTAAGQLAAFRSQLVAFRDVFNP